MQLRDMIEKAYTVPGVLCMCCDKAETASLACIHDACQTFLGMSTGNICHDCDVLMPHNSTLLRGKFFANLQHDALVQVIEPHQLPFWSHTANTARSCTDVLACGLPPDRLVLGNTKRCNKCC